VPLVGYADEVVLDYLDKYPAHLLVLGAFRDRGAGAANAIGLTAHRIVQSAPLAVLLAKGHVLRVRKILACADVDDDGIVPFAAQFARQVGAEFDLLHVVPPAVAPYLASSDTGVITVEEIELQGTQLAAILEQWQTQLEEQRFSRQNIHFRRGHVTESILAMAREGKYDLIIVGSRSGPGHFLNTTANSVVSFAEQAVLVVRTH
jgi:nucleotide-binding universal stress UspA family protein